MQSVQRPPLDDFLRRRANDRRLARLTHDVPMPEAHGLEFGAADNPTPLPERITVSHVDHAANANAALPAGVAVDYVWSGSSAFPEPARRWDFAIAAQVMQYLPNPLGWFRGIYDVLRPGGVLNLSLPDRRFMFDVRRPPSTLGQFLDAFHGGHERPSPGQAFDHTFHAVAVEPAALWADEVDIKSLPRLCGDHALELAVAAMERARAGVTELCHCWVFTPSSFLDLVAQASRVRLFSFVISEFASTEPGECEFFVCLRRDREEDPDRLLALQLDAISHVRGIVERRQRLARGLARN